MLQPINTVLPTIATSPYNVNVALPQISPIDTEVKLQQIASAEASRRAQEAQTAQNAANIELQRQRLAQEYEKFQWDKQKYEDTQLTELDALRTASWDLVDKLTNVQFSNEDDLNTIKKLREMDGIGDNISELIANAPDKTTLRGLTTSIQSHFRRPEVAKFYTNQAKIQALTELVRANPDKYDIGKYNKFYQSIIGDEKVSVSRLTDNDLNPLNFKKSTSVASIVSDALGIYTKQFGFPDTDSDTAMTPFYELVSTMLSNNNIPVTDETMPTVNGLVNKATVPSNAINETALLYASEFTRNNPNIPYTNDIAKMLSSHMTSIVQQGGRPAFNKFVEGLTDDVIKGMYNKATAFAAQQNDLAKARISASKSSGGADDFNRAKWIEDNFPLANVGQKSYINVDLILRDDHNIELMNPPTTQKVRPAVVRFNQFISKNNNITEQTAAALIAAEMKKTINDSGARNAGLAAARAAMGTSEAKLENIEVTGDGTIYITFKPKNSQKSTRQAVTKASTWQNEAVAAFAKAVANYGGGGGGTTTATQSSNKPTIWQSSVQK